MASPNVLHLMTQNPDRRFVFLDALRGIAALSVVFFHAKEGHHLDKLCAAIPLIGKALSFGYLGVELFFVLSGFVIAHSVARSEVGLRYIGRFMVRRSIRLDPPYWTSMLIVVALSVLSTYFVVGKSFEMPSSYQIVMHMLYLQDIGGVPQLNPIYWTLCLEIQFYLLFSLLMLLATHLRKKMSADAAFYCVMIPSLVFANLWPLRLQPFNFQGSCFPMWHLFLAGVLVWWAGVARATGKASLALAVGNLALLLGTGIFVSDPVLMVGSGGAAIILVAARSQRLTTWLAARPFQFLGAISYSLYLVHNPITGAAFRIGYRLTGDTIVTEIFWFAGVTAICISFAYLVHRAVESPALELSRRIGAGSRNAMPIPELAAANSYAAGNKMSA